MNDCLKLFQDQSSIKKALSLTNQDDYSLYLYNSTPNINVLYTASLYRSHQQTIFYIAPNLLNATKAYEYFCQVLGASNVSFYVYDELVSAEVLATSNEFRYERMGTVRDIIKEKPTVIVTNTYAVLKPIANIDFIKEKVINLQQEDVLDIDLFIKNLLELGYKKTPTTESVGEFSVRGGLIDVFAIGYKHPFRIDLFDTEIEKIRIFNQDTQISTNETKSISIYPLYDIIFDITESEKIISNITKDLANTSNERTTQDIESIKSYDNLDKLGKYINYIDPENMSILDYVINPITVFEEFSDSITAFKELKINQKNYSASINEPTELDLKYFFNLSILENKQRQVFFSEFSSTLPNIKLTDMINLHGAKIIDYQGNIKNFVLDIGSKTNYTIVLAINQQHEYALTKESLTQHNITFFECDDFASLHRPGINLVNSSNCISFSFLDNRLEVYTERDIYRNLKLTKTKYKSVYERSTKIVSQDDLSIGDYVVHYDYGIALYKGIKTIDSENIRNDYLWLQYEDMELYVSLDDISLIAKYQGSEGAVPKLTKLSTKEWERRKKRIQTKLEDIAEQLITTQAARESAQGHQYPVDDELSKSFAADFEFQETPDQTKAIKDVTKDMESQRIMDRLLCGDVGYGKTEVAMRAAFKAVLGGKQVLYLAPTTILTRQHFNVFRDRFQKYGIRVEVLSRLVPLSMQNQILKDLKNGLVDILIGTHRVLSEDVLFYDLGLFIIDEEQRFGVVHKEKIKEMKHNVEVLTLTATPIPRTLQMAIMGVRSISLLETPPVDRNPIQTFVLEENDIIIKEAINRELARQGQVFYLHNRISELPRMQRKLQSLVPDARIAIGHGQMSRDELEDIIQGFIDKEYDILLCTTIIETGIDMPNANTLIISNADRFGLSQIYQIRGRVGRSDRLAYAYLTYPKNKVLTQAGKKRLSAIKEFTELGSGYKIALRDLAIRGAGDILGREQSGFIDALGLDIYMRMLNETIAKLKNEEPPTSKKHRSFDIEISKHVSEEYASDEEIRLSIHQEIYNINNETDKNNLILSLEDRYGKLTNELKLYIERKYLEVLMSELDVDRFNENEREVIITFSEKTSKNFDIPKIFEYAYSLDNGIAFEYKHKRFHLMIPKNYQEYTWLTTTTKLLYKIKDLLILV